MVRPISDAPPLLASRLRELLQYDPETGVFRWQIGLRCPWREGGVAGSKTSGGYLRIGVSGCQYQAHRLAWLYVHGRWPAMFIDHINGIRSDNRIANLREATQAQNMQNLRRPTSASTTGFLGVTWHRAAGKWQAQIRDGGKMKYLGLFDTPEEAYEVYLAGKAIAHPFQTLKEHA